jgi:cytochrome c oxidase cbb3-type subunit 2
LYNPRNVVPESKMPAYPWLVDAVDSSHTETKLRHAHPRRAVHRRRHRRRAASLKGKTEMDALVAYLQVLGTAIKSKR